MRSDTRILLGIETSGGYGRRFLEGVARYGNLHGPWSFYVTPGDWRSLVFPAVEQWKPKGIITRLLRAEHVELIESAVVPVVLLDFDPEDSFGLQFDESMIAEVHPNPESVARLAFEHARERRFEHFGFVGTHETLWARQRGKAFRSIVSEYPRFSYSEFLLHYVQKREETIEADLKALGEWLKNLPKPACVLAVNDDVGRTVVEAAASVDIAIPDSLAVIGIDNDVVLCGLSDPPLSSVALNCVNAGYEAAALLDRMMKGETVLERRILVEPTSVETRRSTDVVAVSDEMVSSAVRFIRENIQKPIRVADLTKVLPVSRRGLETRFRKELNRSIHDVILDTRIQRVKQLLSETDLPVKSVSYESGFRSTSHLGVVFRETTGMTPLEYRKRFQL